MSAPVVEPSACTWCGIARRGHAQQYAPAVGWHKWGAPSQEQILARMKARRLALTVAREGALPVPVGPEPQALSAAETRLSQYGEQRGTYGNASEKALHHIALDLRKELSDQRAYEQRLREQHDLDVAANNQLRARIAELEAERHTTNEALDDPVQALRAVEAPGGTYPPALPWAALMDEEDLHDFLGELADAAIRLMDGRAALAEVERACGTWRLIAEAQHGHNTAPGPDAGPDAPEMRSLREALTGAPDRVTSTFVPVVSLREPEGEHYQHVHHDYRVSHDLPETGGEHR